MTAPARVWVWRRPRQRKLPRAPDVRHAPYRHHKRQPGAVTFVNFRWHHANAVVTDLARAVLTHPGWRGKSPGRRLRGWVFNELCRCRQLHPAVVLLTL